MSLQIHQLETRIFVWFTTAGLQNGPDGSLTALNGPDFESVCNMYTYSFVSVTIYKSRPPLFDPSPDYYSRLGEYQLLEASILQLNPKCLDMNQVNQTVVTHTHTQFSVSGQDLIPVRRKTYHPSRVHYHSHCLALYNTLQLCSHFVRGKFVKSNPLYRPQVGGCS